MAHTKITAADLEWEEPSLSRSGGGVADRQAGEIGEMRAALSSRRGSWAVLDTYDKPAEASARANALAKRRDKGDTRVIGCEFAGRKQLDGGSKLYVRLAPA